MITSFKRIYSQFMWCFHIHLLCIRFKCTLKRVITLIKRFSLNIHYFSFRGFLSHFEWNHWICGNLRISSIYENWNYLSVSFICVCPCHKSVFDAQQKIKCFVCSTTLPVHTNQVWLVFIVTNKFGNKYCVSSLKLRCFIFRVVTKLILVLRVNSA